MPSIPSLILYQDVETVLDAVLNFETYPAIIEFSDQKTARKWVHRANTFRRILRKMEETKFELPSGTGSSKYDYLVIAVSGASASIVPRLFNPPRLIIGGKEIELTNLSAEKAEDDDNAID